MTDSLAWVEQLPLDFYRSKPSVEVPDHLSLKMAEWFDVGVRTFLSCVLTGVSIPTGYSRGKIETAVAQEAIRRQPGQVDAVFNQPRTVDSYFVSEAPRPKGVVGGVFQAIKWHSSYVSYDNYHQHKLNEMVSALLWRHGDKPRPTVVFIHGFIAADWKVNEFYLSMKYFYDLGCDVVLKTLPHHGHRRRPESLMSGLEYFSGGIEALNHAVVQSTYDTRSLIDYLQQQLQISDIGLCGLSLGSYTSALIAGLDNRLKFVMPVLPIVSIPDAMMEWKPLDRAFRLLLGKSNVTLRQLRYTMAFHSPLSRPVLLPPERLMLVAAMGDKMATPRHAEVLQEHWGGCRVHWFEGTHALPLKKANANVAKGEFLNSIGFI